MTSAPKTRYTRATDGTNLAYQVSGDGPLDLMILGAHPVADRLSSFARGLKAGQ